MEARQTSSGQTALRNGEGLVIEPEVLEAAVQLVAAALAPRSSPAPAQKASPGPMLTVGQTAALMGISRMTVIRKADAGELPCIVINRGTRQKMRRFPRAAIEQLAAGGIASGQADLKEYTACWLADVAARTGPPGAEAESARRAQH
jgi:excisionase family DNA binding protein